MSEKTNHDLLKEVVAYNRELKKRARELNTRAGDSMFPVLTEAQWEEWLKERLCGAVSVATIPSVDALRLAPLDETLIQIVEAENPLTICVIGFEKAVEYRPTFYDEIRLPRVIFSSEEIVATGKWLDLPEEGICLPGGRAVQVVVSFGDYDTVADADIPRIKEKVRERLNRMQWDRWTVRPDIAVPDMAAEESKIPFITVVYGQCVVTGRELAAYGTVAVNTNRWNANDPWFKTAWYLDFVEAEKERAEAAQKLETLRAEARQRRELEAAKAEAETVREELWGLTSHSDWWNLNYDPQKEVENRRYSYLPSSIVEVRKWTADTKALAAKVEALLLDIQQKREAQKRAHTLIMGLLSSEYTKCPVCDREVVAGSVHYCQAQEILNATGENEIILKVSFRGSKDFMWLVAAYHRYGYEVSINFQEEILRDALLENPGDEEIKTVDLWRAPSASERERTAEISELKQELARIEVERSVPGRVEGAFKTGPERQGKAQLRFEGPFTGQVQNRHAEGGWSTYKNQPVLFVCHDNCHWLNEQPAAGQAWLCTVGFQIAFVGNMPVIVVKPAVRTDGEQAIRARLAELESGLGEMKTASMREVAATGNGVFTEAGKRDFHCAACGATNTLTRGEYAEYRDGNPVTIICINCEASGVVQRKS